MKRSISMSLAGVAAATTLVAGIGTTAVFGDNERVDGSNVQSGTLDLGVFAAGEAGCDTNTVVADGDNVSVLFDTENAWPGQTIVADSICVKNLGTLSGDFDIAIENVIDRELDRAGVVTCTEPEAEAEAGDCGSGPGSGELDDNVSLTLVMDRGCDGVDSETLSGSRYDIFQTATADGPGLVPSIELAAYETVCFDYTYKFDMGAKNEAQSDELGFDLEFSLNQVVPQVGTTFPTEG